MLPNPRWGGRAVECTGLENRHRGIPIRGSNPLPTASPHRQLRWCKNAHQPRKPDWTSLASSLFGGIPTAPWIQARPTTTDPAGALSNSATPWATSVLDRAQDQWHQPVISPRDPRLKSNPRRGMCMPLQPDGPTAQRGSPKPMVENAPLHPSFATNLRTSDGANLHAGCAAGNGRPRPTDQVGGHTSMWRGGGAKREKFRDTDRCCRCSTTQKGRRQNVFSKHTEARGAALE